MAELRPNDDGDLTKADASPTKAFFVHIITRDIQLREAIQDLVDNCVDGAKRLRPSENARLDGLSVALTLSANEFKITDNCGGIPLDVARKYAFKFGRATGFVPTSHSVGQFGVGMKRALFKMGSWFEVRSKAEDASFRIEVDVEKWSGNDQHWDFEIKDLVQTGLPVDERGTEITVKQLDPSVSQEFQREGFLTSLKSQLRMLQQHPMRQGLKITLNGETVIPLEWQLKASEGIQPVSERFEENIRQIRNGEAVESRIVTRVYAGVGDSAPHLAGWYVFCNGRCILAADQSDITGWSAVEQGVVIPKYHGQFARFRGYAFLDADDASILPWNTTKTGLDLDSVAYRKLKPRVIAAMRPIIDFLNHLDAEKDVEVEDRILTRAVTNAASVTLERIAPASVFKFVPPPRKGPPLANISYKRPQAEVDRLKSALQAASNKEVGERSFDYATTNLVDEA